MKRSPIETLAGVRRRALMSSRKSLAIVRVADRGIDVGLKSVARYV